MLSMQKLAVLTVGGLSCTILPASPSHSLLLLLLYHCCCVRFRCRCWACRSLSFSQLGDPLTQSCLHLLPTPCHCLRCCCLSCCFVIVIVFVFGVDVKYAEACGFHSWGIELHYLACISFPLLSQLESLLFSTISLRQKIHYALLS